MKATSAIQRFAGIVKDSEERQASDHGRACAEILSLHDRFRPSLFRYSRSFGLGDSDCEEIIQETFLITYRHLLAGKTCHQGQAWLFTVARHLVLKRFASSRAEVDLSWASHRLDPGLDPEQRFVQAQLQTRLEAVLQALPEQDRECLVLRSEGLRYRDIARVQKRSLGAVALTLKRTLAKISEIYAF